MRAAVAVLLVACTGGSVRTAPRDTAAADSTAPIDTSETTDTGDTEPVDTGGPCPPDMALVGGGCMDLYEAPNVAGALPLVMYTLLQAEDWCEARGKRLCFDDEWLAACEGAAGSTYPYGDTHDPGRCNDEEIWRTYSQSALNQWPWSASSTDIDTLDELWDAAEAVSPTAAEHVEWLYQGEGSGTNAGCVGAAGVYDLVGNVEEWTRRRDGGTTDFHGNLKGRYWAEVRTCQSNITTHGDAFRFYEIGFRCCADPAR